MPEQNAEVLEVNRVISEALGVLTQTDLRSETSRERLARFSAAFRRTESTAGGRALRFRGNSAPRFAKGALSSRSFNLPRSVMWDVHGRVAVPTANPKPLTATANRLILAADEGSLQVDLVRLDRTVQVAGCAGSRDPGPSTPTQRAAAQIPEAVGVRQY